MTSSRLPMAAGAANGRSPVSPALAAAALLLAGIVACSAYFVDDDDVSSYVASSLAHGVIYAGAVWWMLRRDTRPRDLLFILAVAVILRAISMAAPLNLSDDALRYVWDGRIQWAGFNPYLHVPVDEQLIALRDSEIFEDLNQKETAVTIYPPTAEIIFLAASRIYDGVASMKLAMLVFEAITVWALMGWLKAEGLPRERVVIYAWHPLPIWEFASQGHIDAAAIGFLMLGVLAAAHRRQGFAGVVLSCAALVKYYPVLFIPALWRRWDWRLPAAFAATTALLYLPYAWHAGPKVLGFLATHLDNEGYGEGYGFQAIWMLRELGIASPPPKLYVAASAVILMGLGLMALFARKKDEIRPEHLLLLAAAFLFLTSPHYPWYFGILVPLLARYPHPAAFAMTLLCVMLQLPRGPGEWTWTETFGATFTVPLVLWIGVELWRAWMRHRTVTLSREAVGDIGP